MPPQNASASEASEDKKYSYKKARSPHIVRQARAATEFMTTEKAAEYLGVQCKRNLLEYNLGSR